MNSGALQASHRSEEENGTYDNIPTKIAGKCGFYSSTTCQCSVRMYPSSNSFNGKLFSKSWIGLNVWTIATFQMR